MTNALNVLAYQTIQGSGTLSGPVTLAGGTLAGATYSGAVAADSATSTISGGTFNNTLTVLGGATLNVTGTIAPTGVTVNSGGILQGTGTINQAVSLSGTLAGNLTAGGNLTVASTGIVNPGSVATGVGHTAGMLTLGGSSTLTLTSGSTLNFNLAPPRRPEAPTTRSSSAVRSALGGATVNLYNIGTMPMASESYTLMTYASTGSPARPDHRRQPDSRFHLYHQHHVDLRNVEHQPRDVCIHVAGQRRSATTGPTRWNGPAGPPGGIPASRRWKRSRFP